MKDLPPFNGAIVEMIFTLPLLSFMVLSLTTITLLASIALLNLFLLMGFIVFLCDANICIRIGKSKCVKHF